MKKIFTIVVITLALSFVSVSSLKAQSVAINTDGTTAHTSAILDLKSITKGMLAPRMTTVQRTAIATPAAGLLVYDTNTNSFWFYNGTAWNAFSTGSSTNYWSLNGSDIYNNNISGNVAIGTIAPLAYGHGGNNRITEISNQNTGSNIQSHLILSSNGTTGSLGGITWASPLVPGAEKRLGFIGDVYETSNAARMVFYTRNEAGNLGEKLTVLGNGNVGIGTSTPIYKLHVENTGNAIYGNSTGGGGVGVYGNSNQVGVYGQGPYGVYGDGASFGIYGKSTSGYGVYGISTYSQGGYFYSVNNNALWVITGTPNAPGIFAGVFEGSVYSYGSYQGSDKNLKKNIQDVGDAMSIINKLKPKNYEFRNDVKYAAMNLPKGNHYGLIAQELEEVLPGLVAYAPHGLGATPTKPDVGKTSPEAVAGKQQNEISEIPDTKAINYTELIPILIKGMQEQQQQINLLLKRIEVLEKK